MLRWRDITPSISAPCMKMRCSDTGQGYPRCVLCGANRGAVQVWGGMKSIERDGDPGELVGLMPPPPYPPPYPLTHYMLCLGVLIEGARRGSCSACVVFRGTKLTLG